MVIKVISPLVILTMLTSKLGVTFYGQYAITSSLLAIFILLGDLGLSFEIPKRIAKSNVDVKFISNYLSIFIIVKIVISILLSIIIMLFLDHSILLNLLVISCLILGVLNPEPIFHGLEEYRYIARVSFVSKTLQVFLIFVTDFTEIPLEKIFLINFLILFISNTLYYSTIAHRYEVGLKFFEYEQCKEILTSSFQFYFARFFTNFYMQGSTYFLALVLHVDLIAVYSIALDFFKVGCTFIGGIGRVLYTTLSATLDFELLKRVTVICLLLHLVFLVPVFFFGNVVLYHLFPFHTELLYDLTILFYLTLVFSVINSFWGYPVFSAIDKDVLGHSCLILTAFCYYTVLILVFTFSQITVLNATLCILFAEFVGAVLRIFYAIRNKIIP